MGSFGEAPKGNAKSGEKIFKTKCAQCHVVEKAGGHKQGEKNKQNKKGRTLTIPNAPCQKLVEDFVVHNINNDFYFYFYFVCVTNWVFIFKFLYYDH
jgi:cytochrome c